MAVMAINAGQDWSAHEFEALADRAGCGPVVVMIHGYRYAPDAARHDPHRHILAPDPGAGEAIPSWPRALGFAPEGEDGLALGFGWNARGGLRAAYARAETAGAELAALLAPLARRTGHPVALIAHSLGARVALSALSRLASGAVGRIVLMAAAEFQCAAEAAIASPAGQAAEVLNVTSRENDLFDFGMELAVGALRRRALGHGLAQGSDRWLDLQIDHPGTIEGLRGLGFQIDPGARRCCHWSAYRRPGLFDLYRTALRHPERLPLDLLRRHLPDQSAPRWSRLLALPALRPAMSDDLTPDHA